MLDSYISKKKDLEELINKLNPGQKELELAIYDLMINSLNAYKASLNDKANQIIELIKEENSISDEEKIRDKLVYWFGKYGKSPAFIFVLNYNSELHEHNIFGGKNERACIGKKITDLNIIFDLERIAYEDGAILLTSDGMIHMSNVQLQNVNPADIYASKRVKNENKDKLFGFRQSVNTRHYSSLGASFHMPGTIIYTLGEESKQIRRFQQGIITFSTLKEENSLAKRRVKRLHQ